MKMVSRKKIELGYLGLIAFTMFATFAFSRTENASAGNKPTRIIQMERSRMEVGDGDTIFYSFKEEDVVIDPVTGKTHSGKLRLLGYDTPETMTPEYGMFFNEVCGVEATQMVKRILFEEAETVEIHTKLESDQFNRLLAYIVYYDKKHERKLLASEMIRRGFAFESIYHFGNNGFPEFYALVDLAWKQSEIYQSMQNQRAPFFLSPFLWRKLNLRKDLAIEGYDSWSSEKKESWLINELPKTKAEAERRGELTRLKLVEKAKQNPNARGNQEVLLLLDQVYADFSKQCQVKNF